MFYGDFILSGIRSEAMVWENTSLARFSRLTVTRTQSMVWRNYTMKNSALTEEEEKLVRLLLKVKHERDFLIPAFLCAQEEHKIESCIEFIESQPEADDQDVLNFLLEGVPPIQIVDDEDMDDE
jgi:hypothetical protein